MRTVIEWADRPGVQPERSTTSENVMLDVDRAKVLARFWSKVVMGYGGTSIIGSECWRWIGAIQSMGYGHFAHGEGTMLAHRFSYEIHVGKIQPGLELDHKCRVRSCVNPAHLEAVPHAENVRRGRSPKILTRLTGICQRGHVLSVSGVRAVKTGSDRRCLACSREYGRAYQRAKRLEQSRDR